MKVQAFKSFHPWYRQPWYIVIVKILLVPIKSIKQPLENPGKEKPMSKITYETEEAIFEFDLPPAIERLEYYATEHNVDEARELLNFIAESSEESITIPEKYDYFSYVALDLLDQKNGSIICKSCNKTYPSEQLKPTIVGHGKNPLSINSTEKGGIKNVFKRKQKLPGMVPDQSFIFFWEYLVLCCVLA